MKQSNNIATIITTAVISVLATLIVVAILLTTFGVERVANDVSPFVNSATERLTEGIIPPAEREEPKTDADLILDAVASNRGSSVLIYKTTATEENFVARGLLSTTDGIVLTDDAVIQPGVEYVISVPGTRDPFQASQLSTVDDVAILKIDINTTLVAEFTDFVPTTESLVVALNGDEALQIATGIITGVREDALITNIVGAMTPGTPLVAKDGSVIGLSTVGAQDSTDTTFRRISQEYYETILGEVNGL